MHRFALPVRHCVLLLLFPLAVLFGCQLVFGDVDIADPPRSGDDPVENGLCTPGQYRCNREYLLSCSSADTGWTLVTTCPTADRCDSRNKRCVVCVQGQERCNEARREACSPDGSGWALAELCPSADLCSPGVCGPCTPGALECGGPEQRVLRRCNGDRKWEDVEACVSQALCQSGLERALLLNPSEPPQCTAPACPEPGQYRCVGAQLQRCAQDQSAWVRVDDCASPALCEKSAEVADSGSDQCLEGCPAAGAFFCDGQVLKRCNDDRTEWEAVRTCEAGTDCDPIAGDCTQPCTPGAYQCNGAELRRCTPDRTWELIQTCASTALCKPQVNGCQPPACPRAGEFRCVGAELSECNDDLTAWEPRETCKSAALCNAESKRCDPVVCEPAGTLRCFAQELRQCNADLTAWVPPNGATQPLICPAGQYCDANPLNPGCKTQCPTARRCNGSRLETCSADQGWVTQATCLTDALCQCALTDPDGPGPLTHSCPAGLDAANRCGLPLCAANTYRCSGAALEQCSTGLDAWVHVKDCPDPVLCDPGNASTPGRCVVCPIAGETQCTGSAPGSTIRTCAPDRMSWTVTATCTDFECIDDGTADYCAVCNAGDVECNGAVLRRCAANRKTWMTQNCGSPALCDAAGGECDRCVAGSVECDEATLLVCSADGQMQSGTACATPELCDAKNARCNEPACNVGQKRCNGAQPQICKEDRTGYENVGEPCPSAALCRPATLDCALCVPMSRRCTGSQPEVCAASGDAWTAEGDPCMAPLVCDPGSGACKTCIPGSRRCQNGQPQVCTAAGSDAEWVDDGDPCATAALCNPSTGRCQAPACMAGEVRCEGNTLRRCRADRTGWMDTVCTGATPVCNATAGRCDQCAPGATRCVDGASSTCDETGTWGPEMACPSGMCNTMGTECQAATSTP